MLEDRLVDVEEGGGDEGVRALVAQALGERGRALDVDQQEDALLAHRPVVAAEQQRVQRAAADHPAHLQELRDREEDHEGDDRVAQQRQGEIVEPGAIEAVQESEDQAVEGEGRDDDRREHQRADQHGPAEAHAPQPGAARPLHVEDVDRSDQGAERQTVARGVLDLGEVVDETFDVAEDPGDRDAHERTQRRDHRDDLQARSGPAADRHGPRGRRRRRAGPRRLPRAVAARQPGVPAIR